MSLLSSDSRVGISFTRTLIFNVLKARKYLLISCFWVWIPTNEQTIDSISKAFNNLSSISKLHISRIKSRRDAPWLTCSAASKAFFAGWLSTDPLPMIATRKTTCRKILILFTIGVISKSFRVDEQLSCSEASSSLICWLWVEEGFWMVGLDWGCCERSSVLGTDISV